ncbi:hypothetical protein ACHQM5_017727 [Ranunculus cassubicifolius]
MKTMVSKVAVIGSGISGAVCASFLAKNGVSVTIFESARGPGGRMSQRREIAEDGKELYFDHGAPHFAVKNRDAISLVCEWEARGLVAEWKENFGIFDCVDAKFFGIEKEGSSQKYVGVPGMNALCRALCHEPGVEARFGVNIGILQWVEDKKSWLPSDLNGQTLGHFDAVVASDKNIASPRYTAVTGRPPPLDITLVPDLVLKMQEVPVLSCFSLMLAFSEPLSSRVISRTGLQKLSTSILSSIAEELFSEFQKTQPNIPRPFFMRAHRWGSAFPCVAIAGDEKCLWDSSKKLAICGDFCVGPNVEGAILSGLGAATKILDVLGYT